MAFSCRALSKAAKPRWMLACTESTASSVNEAAVFV